MSGVVVVGVPLVGVVAQIPAQPGPLAVVAHLLASGMAPVVEALPVVLAVRAALARLFDVVAAAFADVGLHGVRPRHC